MARINLLPWREELRKARQRQFAVVAVAAAILAGLVVVYVHIFINGLIEQQNRRNQYLRDQIVIVDHQIKAIRTLEKTKANLLARMKIIQQLQRSRPQVVHLFEDLAKTVPAGIYLTRISHKGKEITIHGVAQSNASVSAYMRNIASSQWLKDPRLEVIQSTGKEHERSARFTLRMQQSQPKATGTDQAEAGK